MRCWQAARQKTKGFPADPFSRSTRRVSGPLGPTVNKPQTRIWQTEDDTLELRSNSGGAGIAVLKFSIFP